MPIYETYRDRTAEFSVLEFIAEQWGMVFVTTPTTSKVDGLLLKGGELKGVVEVKRRYNPKDKYETYIIDKAKVDSVHEAAEALGAVGLVVVEFDDCIAYARTSKFKNNARVKTGGRYDRNDAADIDEVYDLPVSLMAVL